MINKSQLRDIIKYTLEYIGLYSPAAEDLIMGTIAQESHLGTYIKQLGRGPALGLVQMEPATHNDIWNNYLKYKPELAKKIEELSLSNFSKQPSQLTGNMYYSIAMCRVHYLRVREAMPAHGDVLAYANYWKKYYNTVLGKGTVQEYITNYAKYVK